MKRLLLVVTVLISSALQAEAATKPTREEFIKTICTSATASAAQANLDGNFFIRLLWKESMFDPNAVSPVGAQGIAQFMPGTAELRGLENPFDPLEAMTASAKYLAELKTLFGNLGAAAAAYNAGEERVRRWRMGKGGMPAETQDYVAFITGQDVEAWREPNKSFAIPTVGDGKDLTSDCVALAMRLKAPRGGANVRLAKRKPWGALVASHFNQGTALSMYRRLKLRAPKLLSVMDPMVIRKRNLSRGTKAMAMVYVGASSRGEADSMCAALRGSGVPCLVHKTR